MTNRIAQTLTKLFDKYRIVFWYDSKKELREDFEALTLEGVEKIELGNNEFGVKYRILRQQPQQKFLLYCEGEQPPDLENWLLDVQLAHTEIRTDQVAMWLAELDLGREFADIVENHQPFFHASDRKEALKRLLKSDDTSNMIRLKMLAVCAESEPRLDTILEALLAELAEKREEKINLIHCCQLDELFWEQMKRTYGYHSHEPNMGDFVIELFKSCYAIGTKGENKLIADALVFLKRWKDSIKYKEVFEILSARCAEVLNIERDLETRETGQLIDLDYFRLIDQKIVSDLVHQIVARTISSTDVIFWVRQRKQSHWYPEFKHLYQAIAAAAEFIQTLHEADLSMESLSDGIQRYSLNWFRLDQYYRQFIYHVRRSSESSLMADLADNIENLYVNNYLLPVNNNWQSLVDKTPKWSVKPVHLQKEFFHQWVEPFLNKDKKILVIISDALRYEIGEELLSQIRQEDRYEGSIEPSLAMLPSYTQLGMAALLPHQKLTLANNDTGIVEVDEQSSQGLTNRIKILHKALSERATAIKAEELMKLNQEDRRQLVRNHDLIYVYHNCIDITGDKRESQERVFEAVAETIEELIKLIKKITAANASNILITSDHGFIYQNRAIDESDFANIEPQGEQILFRDRRFILGKGLKENSSLRTFSSSELGLTGDMEIQIPKSINRLRLKGSGSLYVHGGASLQEVVIPVLKINKKRQSDTTAVEVEIIRGASSIISSGQLAITLYQTQAVTDKIQPRTLRAGIYTRTGELISDPHELTFDLTCENPREREIRLQFLLTRRADEVNGQEVILRFEEKIAGTSHYPEYKSLIYTMRRSFTSDFDF